MKIALLFFIWFTVLLSCKPTQQTILTTGDNSMTSLDWHGTYTGTLPCADCEGIQQVLVLNQDLTYQLSVVYKGKSAEPHLTKGTFSWNKEGSKITLQGLDKKNQPGIYQVGENRLIQLDINGKRITGDLASRYELNKVNADIVNKYWKLVELNGKAVQMSASDKREPHIILHIDSNRISGTGGCNNFVGTYELQAGNRIKFSQNMAMQSNLTPFLIPGKCSLR